MTTASSIITSAYREGNIFPVGTSPTAAQQAEALSRLNNLIKSTLGDILGENFRDWQIPVPQRVGSTAANFPQCPDPCLPSDKQYTGTNAAYPTSNSRIVWGGVTSTVYFPESPNDGARMTVVQGSGTAVGGTPGAILTLSGNGRTIQAAATQTFVFAALPTPTPSKTWLYRADTGDWVLLADLLIGDQLPTQDDIDDFWIAKLAIRLSPPYGKVVSADTYAMRDIMLRKVKAKYKQAAVTTYNGNQIPRSYQTTSGQGIWP